MGAFIAACVHAVRKKSAGVMRAGRTGPVDQAMVRPIFRQVLES